MLIFNDGIFLTPCCALDNRTRVISCLERMFHVNVMAIGTRIAVKSIP
jgi:hypothetical protein